MKTQILTTDPNTGRERAIPAEFLARVRRANELLAIELQELVTFNPLEVKWEFVDASAGLFEVTLELSTVVPDGIGVSSKGWRYAYDKLKDDETALYHLRPAISKLLLMLRSATNKHVSTIWKEIRRDLEQLATLPED